jgi:accessory gene regulator protein AgrB
MLAVNVFMSYSYTQILVTADKMHRYSTFICFLFPVYIMFLNSYLCTTISTNKLLD